MTRDLNPQAQQMADESMRRNLAAQIECIWPQEKRLFERYGLADDIRILDAGCGTGEASGRLAELYPRASVVGVDILDGHLDLARARLARLGGRVRFENRSVFRLGLPDASFDLVACRHVIQAIPDADRALAELARVTRPGGRLHVIAEDYGMIRFPRRTLEPDELWRAVCGEFGPALGIDLCVGRSCPAILRRLGLRDVTVDFVVVDPLRVPRELFAEIWTAWRDGYSEAIGRRTSLSEAEVRAHFDDQIATIRDPGGYGVWLVPVVSGVVEAREGEPSRPLRVKRAP
ncbi:MAG: methyltransferase domain-containing protein [Planctomycetes bacterium]|nr:methyltransferase domain-containing protein [Planctomycetota bacterium]